MVSVRKMCIRDRVETARDKVSDFQAMHFSSINGEIKEIPAEYKCENLFKLDLKATSISGEQSAFEGCSENQSEAVSYTHLYYW